MKNHSTFPSMFFLQQHNPDFSHNEEPESSTSLKHSPMNETGIQNYLQSRRLDSNQAQLNHAGSTLPYLTPSAQSSYTIMSQCNSSNAEKKRHLVPPFQSNMLRESRQRQRKVIQQPVNVQVFKAPARGSQKLSEKIISLQKIVSPYGKTDTSSVLQEAFMYIKIAHQEIRRLKASYFGARTLQQQLMYSTDLRNKGLCLAPVSMASPLVIEDLDDDSSGVPNILNI